MARPQNSARGLFEKIAAAFTTATIAGLTSTNSTITDIQMSKGSTGTLEIDSGALTALPGNVQVSLPNIAFGENSTGAFLAINTTGTTWSYLAGTSIQPA